MNINPCAKCAGSGLQSYDIKHHGKLMWRGPLFCYCMDCENEGQRSESSEQSIALWNEANPVDPSAKEVA